jgi:hypothetical protein
MLDRDAISLEARLVAIEYLLTHLAKAVYLGLGSGRPIPDAVIAEAHENIRQGLREQTFESSPADPVLKDHYAALIFENVDRLLAEFERALKESRAPRTEQ